MNNKLTTLSSICLIAELHERMLKKGAIRSLLALLSGSEDGEAQRFAALALANVASAVFNRVPMVEEGVLEPLILYCPSPLLSSKHSIPLTFVVSLFFLLQTTPKTVFIHTKY